MSELVTLGSALGGEGPKGMWGSETTLPGSLTVST